jgi:hypothetical protein
MPREATANLKPSQPGTGRRAGDEVVSGSLRRTGAAARVETSAAESVEITPRRRKDSLNFKRRSRHRSRIAGVHSDIRSQSEEILPLAGRRLNARLPAAQKTMLPGRAPHFSMHGFGSFRRQAAQKNGEGRMVWRLPRETLSEEPWHGRAVGVEGGNAALAAVQHVVCRQDPVHRLREARLLRKRREPLVECSVRPGNDFVRAQPEMLLSRRGILSAEYPYDALSKPMRQASRQTCRLGAISIGF